MNLEEYKAADEKIKTQVKELIQAKQNLDDQYLAENRKFQDGQKVRVKYHTGSSCFGFVERAEMKPDGIGYAVLQVKKDGNPAKKYLYYSGDCGLEEYRLSPAETTE